MYWLTCWLSMNTYYMPWGLLLVHLQRKGDGPEKLQFSMLSTPSLGKADGEPHCSGTAPDKFTSCRSSCVREGEAPGSPHDSGKVPLKLGNFVIDKLCKLEKAPALLQLAGKVPET